MQLVADMNINIKNTIKKNQSPEDIVKTILKVRGISGDKAVETFLHPPHPSSTSLKYFFKEKKSFSPDFKKTIKLLKEIHEKEKTVVVYCDYDADGLTGGTIMWETLYKLGFKVVPHVPDRKKEGYGFSLTGIDMVKGKHDPALIISVDHGIVAHDQITYAKKLGIEVVVTDHHQQSEHEPKDAFAVFHTSKLSGSGVSFMVAKEFFQNIDPQNNELKKMFETDYVALAAIGTIADMVPLTDISRSIAYHGLQVLSTTKRPGIVYLLKEAAIDGKKLTAYDVGYIIAPRINAVGRLTDATDALRLLCTTSIKRAGELAKHAGAINKKRQDLVTEALLEANSAVDVTKKLFIVHSEVWEEGIIGLVASQLMNVHYKPAVVMTGKINLEEDSLIKGSARSVSGFNITEFLRKHEHLMESVGGHSAAAGFSIKSSHLKAFIKSAEELAYEIVTEELLIRSIQVDIEMPLASATLKLAGLLEEMEPFGIGNPTPVFVSKARVKDCILFGKERNHMRLLLEPEADDDSGMQIEGIIFSSTHNKEGLIGKQLTVVFQLSIDKWNGKEKLVAKIKNLL